MYAFSFDPIHPSGYFQTEVESYQFDTHCASLAKRMLVLRPSQSICSTYQISLPHSCHVDTTQQPDMASSTEKSASNDMDAAWLDEEEE